MRAREVELCSTCAGFCVLNIGNFEIDRSCLEVAWGQIV